MPEPALSPRIAAIAAIVTLAAPGTVPAQDRDADRVTRPEGVTLFDGASRETLVAEGQALFNDPSLGSAGVSCQSCHAEFQQFRDTFTEPYPHPVAMAENMFGLDEVDAAEMVQLCMVVPMASEPLPWPSEELAALTAYVETLRADFAAR
jgi:cytochrome c